eukprot:6610443-Pyramimonas_sp.AAC.1
MGAISGAFGFSCRPASSALHIGTAAPCSVLLGLISNATKKSVPGLQTPWATMRFSVFRNPEEPRRTLSSLLARCMAASPSALCVGPTFKAAARSFSLPRC